MRLIAFRVQNFRSVEDSGWIDVENVTAFVGVNESGKTNLLLPLWKLHPAKEGEIEPTADYQKRLFAEIRAHPKNYTFVTARFELTDEVATIAKLSGYEPEKIRVVEISRRYDGTFTWLFPNAKPPDTVGAVRAMPFIRDFANSLAGLDELPSEAGLKDQISKALQTILASDTPSLQRLSVVDLFSNITKIYKDDHAKKSVLHPSLSNLLDKLRPLYTELTLPLPTAVNGLWDEFKKYFTHFVYYSNYGNLDSEIYLPHVVDNLNRDNLGAKEAAKARTLRVLFSFVGLDPTEILALGKDFVDPQNPQRTPTEEELETIALKKKERSNLLQSAHTKLTAKFKDWWKQGDYRFRFEADGDHFRIWVSDDRRPEEVELEGRSTGLQWFLSFYLVFLVESEGAHKDAILLLDEPGLSLHPLAQRNLSIFFENLSATNQLLYTTHSPFLLSADDLYQARKVYIADDGTTKATANLREGESKKSQPGAAYALTSALNLNVAESLLIGCQPVIVEGPSDQHMLTAMKSVLIGINKFNPRREVVFPPSGGAKSVKTISSILLGRDDELPFVILDDDSIGKSTAADLKSELYKGSETKLINVAEFVQMAGSETEDLVPHEIVVSAVDRIFRHDDLFEESYKEGEPIVPQIEKWALSNHIFLEKGWKVPLSIEIKKRILAKGQKFSDSTVQRWASLFDRIG